MSVICLWKLYSHVDPKQEKNHGNKVRPNTAGKNPRHRKSGNPNAPAWPETTGDNWRQPGTSQKRQPKQSSMAGDHRRKHLETLPTRPVEVLLKHTRRQPEKGAHADTQRRGDQTHSAQTPHALHRAQKQRIVPGWKEIKSVSGACRCALSGTSYTWAYRRIGKHVE